MTLKIFFLRINTYKLLKRLLLLNIIMIIFIIIIYNYNRTFIDLTSYVMFILLINWLIFSYFHTNYLAIKRHYDIYSVYIISELISLYKIYGSLIPGIIYISKENIKYISIDFRKILNEILKGKDPRTALLLYANNQPSEILKEGIKMLVNLPQEKIDLSLLRTFSNKRLNIKEWIRKMEGRLVIAIGVYVFTPILIILMHIFIFDGLLAYVPMFILIMLLIYELISWGLTKI